MALAVFSAANLAVLARTRRFEPYVVALITGGVLFVPLATALGGGLTGSSTGLVFGFLVPAYALMALGPRHATRWFVVFVVMVAVMTAVDPFVHAAVGPAPYVPQLIAQVQNAMVPLTITFLMLRYTDLRRRAAEARVDELLTNAIPRPIAARLKQGETRIAEAYPETTVLFADIVGFTPWAQATQPGRVVALLDDLFTRFDDRVGIHGLEKIKTIGDADMAVAGAPHARADHATRAFAAALAMLDATAAWRAQNDVSLDIRVGMASGTVVAGVIGRQRLLFDLWGDVVNTANRMESSGIPGRIQVAPSTWEVLREAHRFEPREVDVKGLGRMTTWLAA